MEKDFGSHRISYMVMKKGENDTFKMSTLTKEGFKDLRTVKELSKDGFYKLLRKKYIVYSFMERIMNLFIGR